MNSYRIWRILIFSRDSDLTTSLDAIASLAIWLSISQYFIISIIIIKRFSKVIKQKCVHWYEKKKFFSSKILFSKHAKNIKKVAFCTPNGVGR